MTRPDRQPDFRSGGSPDVEFWFEPEMIAIVKYSPFNIKRYSLIEEEHYLYWYEKNKCDMLWPTVQTAYKANLKRLHNEVDKILLGVDDDIY